MINNKQLRVVVLGAGFGGLELSTILSDKFGEQMDLCLIDKNDSFVFGFLLSPSKAGKLSIFDLRFSILSRRSSIGNRQSYVGLGSAIAIALIGVVLVLFEWPSICDKSEPVIISPFDSAQGEELPHAERRRGTSGGFQAHIGTINAKNNIQTFSSTSAESGARVSLRNILIICQSPHDLLDRTMREFQKSLAQLPYVGEVAYYPYGTWPKPGGLLADVFITMSMPEATEKSFIRSRNFKAIIKWTAGSSIFAGTSHADQTDMLEVVRFDIESQLEHESRTFGIESPQARYKLAANSICGEMIGSISKQFENLLDKYGRMPDLPQMLYGTYHEPPELSFLKTDNLQHLISGYGLLKNNHAVWRFTDNRQIDKALPAYRDELKALGWGQEDLGKDYLQMQKENEHIYIFRQRQRNSKAGTIFWSEPEKITAEATLIADYESHFTEDQIQKAMDALLDGDVELKTLLVFEKHFRTPKQLERLQSVIEDGPVNTLDGYLMLARYWAGHGQTGDANQN